MTNPFKIKLAAEKLPVSFVAFDILYLDNEQITSKPLWERQKLLGKTVTESERLAVSRVTPEQGSKLYELAAAQGLEGTVAKKKDSKYYFGKRTKDWVKCKALLDEDFVVCGYYHKDGGMASVVLGSFDAGRLIYRGHVTMGVSREDYKRITATNIIGKHGHCATFPDFDTAVWLEPELVCTVNFMEYTPGGGLRQPVFKGLRDDKHPEECVYKAQQNMSSLKIHKI